ncbi:MAG: AEC family transporter [Anaerolineae bacterium]
MLDIFFRVLVTNIAPTFLIVAVGFALDRALQPHVQSISRMALYALTPAFIFSSLVQSELQNAQITGMVAYATAVILTMTAVSLLTARLLRLDTATGSAFVLATALTNAGNFGLSLVLFAYGESALQLAVVYFVTSSVLSNTVGAFIAARCRGNWRQSLLGVLRLPSVYAAIAAVVLRLAAVTPPDLLMRPVDTLGQAAVPVMLVLLGMQLSRGRLQNDKGLVAFASTYKLVVMALLAVAMASIFHLDGPARRVGIVESATPAAVTGVLLATEFGARPDIVASTVFVSTLGAALSLTIIMGLLA